MLPPSRPAGMCMEPKCPTVEVDQLVLSAVKEAHSVRTPFATRIECERAVIVAVSCICICYGVSAFA